MHEYGWHQKGLIGITEPRRIAAVTLAERVSSEMGDVLGETVGVSIRFISKFNENTKIKVLIVFIKYIKKYFKLHANF